MKAGSKQARDSFSSLRTNRRASWARAAISYSGPKKLYAWGSEELITGFCLEALLHYRLTSS